MKLKTPNTSVKPVILVLLLLVLVLVFCPMAIIWSLNTLFPMLAIPFGFYQWLAIIILNCTWFARASLSNKKD
jgi:hypothetical protein